MNYVIRILYCSSLFFGLFSFLEIKPTVTQPVDSPYLSSEKIEHWILIHGTFARVFPWYKKGGSGYEALAQALTNSGHGKFILHSFLWSSYNSHPARLKAAEELKELLQQLSTNTYHTIHIVTHSHGGTVALLAAQMIAEHPTSLTESYEGHRSENGSRNSPIRIHELFTLGMPVHVDWYPRAWNVIDRVYHLFSYGDFVQPVFTMFERMLPEAPHVYNLPVKKNNEGLQHTTLRSPDILMQLPTLRTLFTDKGNYCLHLTPHNNDTSTFTVVPYSTEEKEKDNAIDQAYIKQILNLYAETRKVKLASLASRKSPHE